MCILKYSKSDTRGHTHTHKLSLTRHKAHRPTKTVFFWLALCLDTNRSLDRGLFFCENTRRPPGACHGTAGRPGGSSASDRGGLEVMPHRAGEKDRTCLKREHVREISHDFTEVSHVSAHQVVPCLHEVALLVPHGVQGRSTGDGPGAWVRSVCDTWRLIGEKEVRTRCAV